MTQLGHWPTTKRSRESCADVVLDGGDARLDRAGPSLQGLPARHGLVHLALGQDLLVVQVAGAALLDQGQLELSLGVPELCVDALEVVLESCRVETNEDVTLGDGIAVLDVACGDAALDLGRHQRVVDRTHRPEQLDLLGDRLASHGLGDHQGGRWAILRRGGGTRAQHHDGQGPRGSCFSFRRHGRRSCG